jgi:hypothetical protein
MEQISKKTPNPKCRRYWCLLEFIDWSKLGPSNLLTGPPTPKYRGMYSYQSLLHTVCNGGGGSRVSDRYTPAAKYHYWPIFKKSRHLGFGIFIDIWSMVMTIKTSEQEK